MKNKFFTYVCDLAFVIELVMIASLLAFTYWLERKLQ